jgi:hypothetical protein
MEAAFRAALLASAGVTALAGSRVNWLSHPQSDALPAVVLTVVSDAEGYTLDGRNGLSQGRVQVDCYAMAYKAARDLAAAVRAALSGYRGGDFRLIEHVATRDFREGGTDEAERPYRVSMDFLTHWRAS